MSPATKAATAKMPAQPAVAGDDDDGPITGHSVAGVVVMWTGIVAGTSLAVLDWARGVRVRIPGLPHWLGYLAGFVLVWLVFMLMAWWGLHMMRRHHRAMARNTLRAGRTGAVGAAGLAGRGAKAAHGWAGPRWGERHQPGESDVITQQDSAPPGQSVAGDDDGSNVPATTHAPLGYRGGQEGDPMIEAITRAVRAAWCGSDSKTQAAVRVTSEGRGTYVIHLPMGVITVGPAGTRYDGAAAVLSKALGSPASVTGAQYTTADGAPVSARRAYYEADGVAVGLQLLKKPEAGPAGPAPTRQETADALRFLPGLAPGAPASGANGKNGDQENMTTPNGTVPPRMRLSDAVKAGAPPEWNALADSIGEAEPESDEEYLDLLAGQIAGMSVYGEAIADLYETCVDTIRLDPVAMASLHDVADAAGDFVTAIAYARSKFANHYQEVREFTADGGVLPKDGDFITGEGDA